MSIALHHLKWDWSPAYFGHGAVVDLDEITGGGIHLETLVEGKGRLDLLGSCTINPR